MLEFPRGKEFRSLDYKGSPANIKHSERKKTIFISLVWHFRNIRTEKNLKVPGKNNQVTYQNLYIRLASPISAAALVARRQWTNGFDILRQGCFCSRIWQQAKLFCEDKIKTFSDVQGSENFLPHHLSQEVTRE